MSDSLCGRWWRRGEGRVEGGLLHAGYACIHVRMYALGRPTVRWVHRCRFVLTWRSQTLTLILTLTLTLTSRPHPRPHPHPHPTQLLRWSVECWPLRTQPSTADGTGGDDRSGHPCGAASGCDGCRQAAGALGCRVGVGRPKGLRGVRVGRVGVGKLQAATAPSPSPITPPSPPTPTRSPRAPESTLNPRL